MRRFMPLLAVVALGCQDIGPIGELEGQLFATPFTLLDWGDVPVGAAAVATIELSADRAPVTIEGLSVQSITRQGTFFSASTYVDNFGAASLLGDVADTDAGDIFSLVGEDVPVDGSRTLQLVFRAETPGYFQGSVEIVSDAIRGGVPQTIIVPLRAHAAEPCVQILPPVLDFGNVPGGGEACEDIEVTACGSLPVIVTDLAFQSSNFDVVDDDIPLTIPAGSTTPVEVCFSPNDARPVTSLASFLSGQEALSQVTLRANDCLNGLPIEYDQDNDGFTTCGGDCDDDDPTVNPSGIEAAVPDGKDNDCDGYTDNHSSGYDDDQDGYCEATSCLQPGVLPGDCNDGDDEVNPGVPEDYGDGIDNDCDGTVDNGTADLDGDGYTVEAGDCDDDPNGDGADRFPGNPEVADGVDNDCDGLKDEGTVAYDDDGDGYCEIAPCTDGSDGGDCDDRVSKVNPLGPHPGATAYPGATELEDGIDNDCNGKVDDRTSRYDDDGDGYAEIGGDCDDTTDTIAPNVLEIPENGIDDDCNPATPVGRDE